MRMARWFGCSSMVVVIGAILVLAPGGVHAQGHDPAPPGFTVAVTPDLSIGRRLASAHALAFEAVSLGTQVEVTRGGALGVTLDVGLWAFAVACTGVAPSCGETGVSAVAGVRYAPRLWASRRVVPYLGGGAGALRLNDGHVGLVGSARAGVDIGLGRNSALRLETKYQPIRQSGYSDPIDRHWVEVDHLQMISVGFRMGRMR
jgi:hypothetical protein